jgi:hypothetical protein
MKKCQISPVSVSMLIDLSKISAGASQTKIKHRVMIILAIVLRGDV